MEEEMVYGLADTVGGKDEGVLKITIFFKNKKIRDEKFKEFGDQEEFKFIKFKIPYAIYDQYFGEK